MKKIIVLFLSLMMLNAHASNEECFVLEEKRVGKHSASIQKALDGNSCVLLSEGVYLLDESLVMNSFNSLIGRGRDKTILKASENLCKNDSEGKCRMIIGHDIKNYSLLNFSLKGEGRAFGVSITLSTHGLIKNIAINDMGAHGVALSEGSQSNKIIDSYYNNIKMFAITIFSDGHYNEITNNIVQNSGYGIVIDDATTGGLSMPSNNNNILDNVLLGTGMGILIEGSSYNLVKNNFIYGLNEGLTGIDVWAGGYDGVSRPLGSHNVIIGNKVIVKSQYGIRYVGKDSVIEGNTIVGPKYEGVFVRSIKDWDPKSLDVSVSIEKNNIFQAGRWAIRVEECSACQISKNIFIDSGQESISLYPMFDSGIANTMIKNNHSDVHGKGSVVSNGDLSRYKDNIINQISGF